MKLSYLAVCWLLSLCQLFFIPAAWLADYPLLFIAALGLLLPAWLRRYYRYRTYFWFGGCLLFFAGYQQHYLNEVLRQGEKIAQLQHTALENQVKIIGLRQLSPNLQLVAEVDLTAYQLGKQKVHLNWQAEQSPQLGDIWRVRLTLRPLSSRLNEGGFNRQRWLLSQSVFASATVKQAALIRSEANWRQRLLARTIEQTEHLPYQGVMLALAFGERAWLNSEDWQLFRESGTAHLIAISGLHIGLVAGLVWGMARILQYIAIRLFATPSAVSHRLPHLFALSAAVFYAYLADFLLPTERALWAYAFWLLLIFSRIYLPPWKLLLFVVAWLSWLDPLSVLNESFWLSCGAVLILCFYYAFFPLSNMQWRGRGLRQFVPSAVYWLLGLVHLQLGLLLLFTPLQIFIFHAMPLGALWSNLLLVPIFSLVLVPLILLALCLNFFFNAVWLWQIVDIVLQRSLHLLAQLPNAYLTLSNQQQQLILSVCFGVVFCLLFHRYRTLDFSVLKTPNQAAFRRALYLSGGAAVITVSLLLFKPLSQADWRLEMLDVGQGLAMLLVSDDQATLFDTGQAWQGGSMAETEILPYLRRQGLNLQQIIVSHDDNDHAGGVPALLNAFPNALLIQASTKDYGAQRRRFCHQGVRWQWQGFEFEALAPMATVVTAKNQDSCVLLVGRDQLRFVLSGDIAVETEKRLAAQIGKIDWLQVAHHGSNSSSSWLWLAKLQPKIALISSGLHNRWRLPHSAVLARLQQMKSAVYNTALDGQIRITVQNGRWQIHTVRNRLVPWYQIIIGLDKEIQLE
ncbi:DNA internalization-related competence protein ComEC/Rec2 [Testudinibacter sp. P80/BLE/0925]|uniref:DNA internalization-related competence protein ComEC/Rec2 n=1 Tax=Testudinibacter sp. TW-1 TaxID=3417757 RepID=UPI003D36CB45